MSEKEITYTLYRGARFVLSGKKDTINLYLRLCLDKWEEALIGNKRMAEFVLGDEVVNESVILTITKDKDIAYPAWRMEMIDGGWKVVWSTEVGTTEEKMYHIMDAEQFFSEDMKK